MADGMIGAIKMVIICVRRLAEGKFLLESFNQELDLAFLQSTQECVQ